MGPITLEDVSKIASLCSDTLTKTISIASQIKRGNLADLDLILDLRNDASRFKEWEDLLGHLLLSVDDLPSTTEVELDEWMPRELILTLLSAFAQLQGILLSPGLQGSGFSSVLDVHSRFKVDAIFRSTQCQGWLEQTLANCRTTSVPQDLKAAVENLGDLVDCLWSYGAVIKMKIPEPSAVRLVAMPTDSISNAQGYQKSDSPSPKIVFQDDLQNSSIPGSTPAFTSKLGDAETTYPAVSQVDFRPTHDAQISISPEPVLSTAVTLVSSTVDAPEVRNRNAGYEPVVNRLAPTQGSVTWLTGGKPPRVTPAGGNGAQLDGIKTVLVGDGATGKTCLCRTFAHGYPCMEYIPTVFDNYTIKLNLPEEPVTLNIFDTAGQEDYDRLRPLSYPETDVMIVNFSIANENTLYNVVEKWYPEVEHHIREVQIVLAGLQSDARDSKKAREELQARSRKPVSYTRGVEIAKEIGASAYVECSSLNNQGVVQLFQVVAELGLKALTQCQRQSRPRSRHCLVM